MAKIAALKDFAQSYNNQKQHNHASPMKKRRSSWVDVGDDEPPRKKRDKSSRTDLHPVKKKGKRPDSAGGSSKPKTSSIQEQRNQLPIAQGSSTLGLISDLLTCILIREGCSCEGNTGERCDHSRRRDGFWQNNPYVSRVQS